MLTTMPGLLVRSSDLKFRAAAALSVGAEFGTDQRPSHGRSRPALSLHFLLGIDSGHEAADIIY